MPLLDTSDYRLMSGFLPNKVLLYPGTQLTWGLNNSREQPENGKTLVFRLIVSRESLMYFSYNSRFLLYITVLFYCAKLQFLTAGR